MVRCNVTTLSQPAAFVNVWVGVAVAVYVTPYQTKFSQADAVVSPVLGEQVAAEISFKETPATVLFNTTLLAVIELLLLSNNQDVPL